MVTKTKIQTLEKTALEKYQDLLDTILVIEAIKSDSGENISWKDLKSNLKEGV